MKRLSAALLMLSIACGHSGSGTARGTVEGRATSGPSCPVQQAGVPCPDRPVQAEIVVKNSGGREVSRIRTGSDGRFTISLPAGTYVFEPLSPNNAGLPSAQPFSVTVSEGHTTRADVHYDSGIR